MSCIKAGTYDVALTVVLTVAPRRNRGRNAWKQHTSAVPMQLIHTT